MDLTPKKRREVTNVTLEPELKARAVAFAEKHGLSLSELICRALGEVLDKHALIAKLDAEGFAVQVFPAPRKKNRKKLCAHPKK